MKVSSRYKINDSLHKIIFYELNRDYNLREIIKSLIAMNYERLYFSFGRFDISYSGDRDIEQSHENVLNKIKSLGEIRLVYERTDDVFAYSGYFNVNDKQEVTDLIINMFDLYYSCSINFIRKNVNYNTYHKLVLDLYKNRDIDNKRLFNSFNYDFSLFKPLSPNEAYLTYNKKCELPIFIKDKIPLPPMRAKSLFGRFKESIFGYPWVTDNESSSSKFVTSKHTKQ